ERLAVEEHRSDGEGAVGPLALAGALRRLPPDVVEDDHPAQQAEAVHGGHGVGQAGLVLDDAGGGLGAAVLHLDHRPEAEPGVGGGGGARRVGGGLHVLALHGPADRAVVGEVALVDVAALLGVLVAGLDHQRRRPGEAGAGALAAARRPGRGGEAGGRAAAAAAGGLEAAAAASVVGALLGRGLQAAAGGRGRQALVGDQRLAE